ncbi:MAG: PhzF family phenazine biosynthesis protein [Dehalococcoidia bacterium]|nr:PhzF family phenazine biosynthesis protein [Dehalococcoidia bacterium]
MERSFYLLDVFAEGVYSGNQLAVFRNAASIVDEDRRRLAREVHFSETAFILSDVPRNGSYDVRVFTPTGEVPFSGHAVLGAAYVLQTELICEPLSTMSVNLVGGPVQVSFTYHYNDVDEVWVNHMQPSFGEVLDKEMIASVLGLTVEDIVDGCPVQEVSTGLPFIMVPLRSLDAIHRACVVAEKYGRLMEQQWAQSLYIFAGETYDPDNDFNVRMFADCYGIAEDPATGAGAGCLAAYALQYLRSDSPSLHLRIEQGYEIRRPSILFARARHEGDHARVSVGGRVGLVARGSFV